jgi:hypothetical protein
VANTVYANDLKQGWGVAPYLWQSSVSLQQELRPNVALTVGYFRTWYGNIYVTDNLKVTTADFTPYCITAPTDSRLPGGGGYPVCGLFDVSPAKFGSVSNLIENSSAVGGRTQVFNGVDVLINARFRKGRVFAGGLSTGQTTTDNCAVAGGVPSQFCRITSPWQAQTQIKFSGVYPLPWWGLQTSATFQNVPGLAWSANLVATNAQIAPSLGRNLAACPAATGPCNATATISLIAPNTVFEHRGNQIDLRLSKIVQLGRARLQGNLDVYNLTNQGDIISMNNSYGLTWTRPVSIMTGRLFKLGAQLNF